MIIPPYILDGRPSFTHGVENTPQPYRLSFALRDREFLSFTATSPHGREIDLEEEAFHALFYQAVNGIVMARLAFSPTQTQLTTQGYSSPPRGEIGDIHHAGGQFRIYVGERTIINIEMGTTTREETYAPSGRWCGHPGPAVGRIEDCLDALFPDILHSDIFLHGMNSIAVKETVREWRLFKDTKPFTGVLLFGDWKGAEYRDGLYVGPSTEGEERFYPSELFTIRVTLTSGEEIFHGGIWCVWRQG